MGLSISSFNGESLGRVTQVTFHGNPGCGVYVLHLNLKLNAGNLKSDACITQLRCALELASDGIRIASGVFQGNPVVRWTEYSEEEQLGFDFYLTGNQIQAIESHRGCADLRFGIWLSGEASYKEKSQGFSDKGEFLIPKQQWLKALGSMKYQDTLLVELIVPRQGDVDYENLLPLIERAQIHILDGNYQEAVGLCRQAIELVEEARKDKQSAKNASQKYKEDRESMGVSERMLFLREALKNIVHLGNHHQGGEFSRRHAISILGMTVALLSAPELSIGR